MDWSKSDFVKFFLQLKIKADSGNKLSECLFSIEFQHSFVWCTPINTFSFIQNRNLLKLNILSLSFTALVPNYSVLKVLWLKNSVNWFCCLRKCCQCDRLQWQKSWFLINGCKNSWENRVNWFQQDPPVYSAHPCPTTGGLTNHFQWHSKFSHFKMSLMELL